jgi:hypothetical protein
MTREEFVAQLERGVLQGPSLPVSSGILRWTADQLKKGEPPWWKAMLRAWEKRAFVADSEAWALYLTALHYEALSDAECPLVPFFPSCGGTADAEPSPGLAKFLATAGEGFYRNLRDGDRRTYIPGRAALWMVPAQLLFHRRNLPYYLVEVNAGAGLNLCADATHPTKGFDSDLIEARVGLDRRPLVLEDINDRRWLTAGVWPDNAAGVKALDDAIETVQKVSRSSATFLQLAECPAAKAPAFIAQNIPTDDAEVGLLVFNMGTTARMNDADYAAYAAGMAKALAPWGDRAAWVEAEAPRGEPFSMSLQLRAHRLWGGQFRTMVGSTIDLSTGQHQYNAAFDAFLGPESAPKPSSK